MGGGGKDWIDVAQNRDRLAGSCECGYEPSGSVKCGEFPEYLRTCQLLKKASAQWTY